MSDVNPNVSQLVQRLQEEIKSLRDDNAALKSALEQIGGWSYALVGRLDNETIQRVEKIMLRSGER